MVSKKLKLLVVMLLCFTGGMFFSITSVQATTLNQAIHLALQDNPDILTVVKNKMKAENRVRYEKASFFPEIGVRATAGAEYHNFPDSKINSNTFLNQDDGAATTSAGFSLRQMIFDGWSTTHRVDASLERSQASSYQLKAKAEQVALEVSRAFLDVLQYSKSAQVARHHVETHKKYVQLAQSKAAPDQEVLPDVSLARARLNAAEVRLTTMLKKLRNAVAAYQRLVGHDPFKLARPEGAPASLPANLNLAVERALANNPLVIATEREVKAAFSEAAATQSSFLPKIDVELDGESYRDRAGYDGNGTDLSALLVFRYDLYKGGADTARQREAIYERSRKQSVLDSVKRLVAEETKLAWHALEAVREEVVSLQEVTMSTHEYRNAHYRGYIAGQTSLKNVLDAEHALAEARVDLNSHQYDVLFQSYRVLAAIGAFLNTMDLNLPDHYIHLAEK